MSRGPVRLIAVLVLTACLIGFKLYGKSSSAKETLAEAHEVCTHCSMCDDNSSYIDGLCDLYHESAFDHHYTLGGRHSSSKFDADGYYEELFENMANHAAKDGRKDIAKAITDLGHSYVAPN